VSAVGAEELVRIQLTLECKGVVEGDRLVRIPCAEPDDIPRVFIAQYDGGCASYVRHDVPVRIYERLVALPPEEAMRDHEAVKRLLAEDVPCDEVSRGKSYLFPDTLSHRDYPDAVRLGPESRAVLEDFAQVLGKFVERSPVFAVLAGGRVASMCVSSRENAVAAEAWVETRPEFRRRGFAGQVTAAWGHELVRRGKIPFYSHRVENTASESVARSLGLGQWKTEVAYS
jgi:hypothetical protein